MLAYNWSPMCGLTLQYYYNYYSLQVIVVIGHIVIRLLNDKFPRNLLIRMKFMITLNFTHKVPA